MCVACTFQRAAASHVGTIKPYTDVKTKKGYPIHVNCTNWTCHVRKAIVAGRQPTLAAGTVASGCALAAKAPNKSFHVPIKTLCLKVQAEITDIKRPHQTCLELDVRLENAGTELIQRKVD